MYCYACVLSICLLCIIPSQCYTCGIMNGNWMMIEMMSIYCDDYDYTCIVLIWLILQMRYPPLNYTEVHWIVYNLVYMP